MMKWAFLLSHETLSHGGKTFYQFIPYKYGPYSFTLNQETDSLIRNGYLEKKGDNLWKLTPLGEKLDISLPKKVSHDIKFIVSEYGELTARQLVNLVYENYSWFTVNSTFEDRKKEKRPVAEKAIYTAGYEGRMIDDFLNLLMKSGITRLIDVRSNPISRKYGFHKTTLNRLCKYLEIDYQHIPGLGISSLKRSTSNSESEYDNLFEDYRRELPSKKEDLQNIMKLLKTKPSVLVCMEANPQHCHRNILAQYLIDEVKMPIKHLGYPT